MQKLKQIGKTIRILKVVAFAGSHRVLYSLQLMLLEFPSPSIPSNIIAPTIKVKKRH